MMESQSSSMPVGYVVGESHPDRFTFVSSSERVPPLLEYLVVDTLQPDDDGQSRRVQVLAQVAQIGVDSAVLSEALTFEETRTILSGAFAPAPKVLGVARVVGYLDGVAIRMPRISPLPGQAVQVASDDLLRAFFSRSERGSLDVGTLLNRPEIQVALDVNGLRRHLAVIAQTGAGKSYLTGKLLEALIGLGGTVLVLDPNSDYVQIRKRAEDADTPYDSAEKTAFADRVTIYRVPGVQGRRLGEDLVGPTRDFTVQFSALEPNEICDLAGIPSSATRIREAVTQAAAQLTRAGLDFRPAELYQRLQSLAGQADPEGPGFDPSGEAIVASTDPILRDGARRALVYLDGLRNFGIWGFQDVPIDRLIEPRRLTVIDLAGTDKVVASYVADRALREIWSRALTGRLPYPVFVVLEEAHNLVPPEGRGGGSSRAARIVNTVAAEGRKFQVFLVVVTQRPSRVHQDTLSQCGSQLIMRLTNPDDQRAVRSASEQLSDELLGNLPGLNTGEAIVVGPLTRAPAMIRVGRRDSAEGGADIDLVAALERATEDAGVSTLAEERMQSNAGPSGPRRESWL
ncbi:MAG: ATP-binding protein [Chloroflexi bacterium]|nr:ATP-binding protein [Chloroflexota bacterium]